MTASPFNRRFTITINGRHPFENRNVRYATMGMPKSADNKEDVMTQARLMAPEMAESFSLDVYDGDTMIVCFYKRDGKVIEEVPTLIGDGEPEFIEPMV